MQEFQCQVCGKKFLRYRYQKPKYCSQKCHFADHRRIAKCPTCGKEKVLQSNKPQKDYCSLKCWGIAHRVVSERDCATCNKSFRPKTTTKKSEYCSKLCADKGKTLPRDEYWKRWKLRVKEYRKRHPEKTAQWKQNRRAREVGAEGSFTSFEWIACMKKHGNKCAECKEEKKLTVDHKIPLSKGGTNYIENIQPLCLSCNSRKSAKI